MEVQPTDVSRSASVLVVGFPDLYGAGRILFESARALHDEGFAVTVVFPERGPLIERLVDIGIETHVEPFPVLRKADLRRAAILRKALATPVAVFRMCRLIRQLGADVVYANGLPFPEWLVAARLMRRRAICHLHEAEDGMSRVLSKILVAPLLCAHEVIANSTHSARWIYSAIPRLRRKTGIIHNGFDLEHHPRPLERDPSRLRLGLVGRISPRKGQEVAVRVLHELRSRGHDAELVIAGSVFRGYESCESELRSLIATLGLEARVAMIGEIDDPRAVYTESDVILVPSTVEPFGNVAVEAMGAARPVVASAVGGLREIVRHGENGLLFPVGDVKAAVAMVELCISFPEEARKMATRAASDVRERFGLSRFQGQITALVRQSIESSKDRARRGLVVAVVGPDGTGKSTLVAQIPTLLPGVEVHRRYWRPGLLPALGPMVGNPVRGPVTDPHGRGVHPWPKALLRIIYYWIDFVLGHWLHYRRITRRGGIVLVERGWHDIVVDPRRYLLPSNRVVRFLGRVVPPPDLTLVLDLDPTDVLARKKELTEEELTRQLAEWRRFAVEHPRRTAIIDSSSEPEVVATEAVGLIRRASAWTNP